MVVCVKMMSKGSKETLTVLIVTHVTHVERFESGVCGLCTQCRYISCCVKRIKRVERLCYVEARDKHIFAHNFLNIQAIFNPKLFQLWTPLTCFDIHGIGWYGCKG